MISAVGLAIPKAYTQVQNPTFNKNMSNVSFGEKSRAYLWNVIPGGLALGYGIMHPVLTNAGKFKEIDYAACEVGCVLALIGFVMFAVDAVRDAFFRPRG